VRFIVPLLLAASIASPSSAEPVRITGLRVIEESNRSRIEIDLSEPVECRVRRIHGTDLLLCELPGCIPDRGVDAQMINGRYVRSVHVLPRAGETLLKITLGSNDVDYRYSVERNTARFVIDLLEPPAKVLAQDAASASSSAGQAPPQGTGTMSGGTADQSSPTLADKAATAVSAAPAVNAATTDAASTEASKAQSAPVSKTEAEDAAKNTAPATKSPSKKRDTKSAPARGADAEVATLLEKARRLIEDGDVAKGLSYLEVAAAALKNPKDKAELFLKAARTGKAHKLFAQAARFYERLASMELADSLDAAVRIELGECLASAGDSEGAIARFDEALATATTAADSSAARRARAEHHLREERGEDAVEDLEVLAARGRDDAERIYAAYRLGVFFSAAGNPDEALLALDQIPQTPPASTDSLTAYIVGAALVRRADTLYRAGRHEKAIPLYEVLASRAEPDAAPWALFQLGNIERRGGRYGAARARYEELATRWPESRWAKMARWGESESSWLLRESGGRVEAPRGAKTAGPSAG
jgi:tetratricopeptide (TPR) repeat protein